MSQGVWNLRLELGHQLEPEPMRTTEFAPAIPPVAEQTAASPAPASGYGPPATATFWKTGRFSGPDFPLQSDGTLRCPAGQKLIPHERRREAAGSLRLVYAASIRRCRPCSVRDQWQWQGSATTKPRQVSVLLHPLVVGPEPIRWRDGSRRAHRRACLQLVRQESRSGGSRASSHGPPGCQACTPLGSVSVSKGREKGGKGAEKRG